MFNEKNRSPLQRQGCPSVEKNLATARFFVFRRLVRVYHHPHWALAYGIAAFLFQQALLAFDFIQRDVVGFLPRRHQEFTAVINIKAARLGFGWLEAFDCQHAAIFRDTENGNQA